MDVAELQHVLPLSSWRRALDASLSGAKGCATWVCWWRYLLSLQVHVFFKLVWLGNALAVTVLVKSHLSPGGVCSFGIFGQAARLAPLQVTTQAAYLGTHLEA